MISKYTPICEMRPRKLTPPMLNASCIGDEDDGEDQDLIRIGRIDGRLEDVVDQRARIEDQAGVHGGDGHDQRPSVDPTDPPSIVRPDQVLAPLEQCAGNRIVAAELGEHERDKQLPQDDDGQQPDVPRTGGADTEDEQRVDADDRRDVAEGNREVLEQVEHTPQLLPVPKPRQLGGIRLTGLWRRDHGFATHVRVLHPSPPWGRCAGGSIDQRVRGSARGRSAMAGRLP